MNGFLEMLPQTRNIKDGVCAQIEKNFAKAKWKKAVRVTTLMKRLRASEPGDPGASGLVEGAAAEPSGAPAPAAGGSNLFAAASRQLSAKRLLRHRLATITAVSLPSAGRQEEQPQAPCNGDVTQVLPEKKED
ncbi:hypothetical protein KUCAC02_030872 [Chaenocephalus aceratus]|uniref:Uncharacterized protein n=1 Tax=Chaenocephalus aceratus TaxID=36190 RepID=A0ACB9XKU9_CHAAC|nr:hypothetical protein KUCAC02_030872 [Chaenocephalus aceratus]